MGAGERGFKSLYPDVLKKIVTVVVVVGSLTACGGFPSQSPPRPSQPMQTSTQNTGYYCDTVAETQGKSDAMKKIEGPLSDRIRYQGIPLEVVEANRNYFKEFEAKTAVQLGKDYAEIIKACRETGWKPANER